MKYTVFPIDNQERILRVMRHTAFTVAVSLLVSSVMFAQDWVEYKNIEDGFQIAFPSQPQAQQTTFTSQYGYMLPEKTYSVVAGAQRFSVTVVDYRGIEQQAIARACPEGKKENCPTRAILAVIGVSEWRNDVRGAIAYSLNRFTSRNARIVSVTGDWQDLVEGMMLTLDNPDKSRTAAAISMHDNRLYIVEATAPLARSAPAIAFPQNFGYLDKEGKSIRYRRMYSNNFHGLGDYPPPPR